MKDKLMVWHLLQTAKLCPNYLKDTNLSINEARRFLGRSKKQINPKKKTMNSRDSIKTLIELLKELAPEQPMNQDEQGGCVWCGWSEQMMYFRLGKYNGSRYSDERFETHTSACPWVKARKVIEENGNKSS